MVMLASHPATSRILSLRTLRAVVTGGPLNYLKRNGCCMYNTTRLYSRNHMFRPNSTIICIVWSSEQTVLISSYRIKFLS